jgi:hypothetical protein
LNKAVSILGYAQTGTVHAWSKGEKVYRLQHLYFVRLVLMAGAIAHAGDGNAPSRYDGVRGCYGFRPAGVGGSTYVEAGPGTTAWSILLALPSATEVVVR